MSDVYVLSRYEEKVFSGHDIIEAVYDDIKKVFDYIYGDGDEDNGDKNKYYMKNLGDILWIGEYHVIRKYVMNNDP